MEFCPKCGSMLITSEAKSKIHLVCRKCGFKKQGSGHLEIKERLDKKPLDDIVFVEKSEETLPVTKAICPKCSHKEAVWWVRQMRSADESPTVFYRCTKCQHSWREYG
ncbi:MAG: transcription factor S [Candidatus Aenigmarchaeota archaeon]|nr:transcription factor S [Candidatus Aenigmarchaeota archaeon]